MKLLKRWSFKGIIVLAVLTVIVSLNQGSRTQVASAHPLGNFTINHYSRIALSADAITLRYIIDMAEVPAFQEISRIDLDQDGNLSDEERTHYMVKKPVELQKGIHISIDESPVGLSLVERDVSLPEGQGGLSTLRLNLLFQGQTPLPDSDSEHILEYRDENYPQRIGWKEIVVQGGNGIAIVDSTVPRTDLSDELRGYPNDLSGSPPDQRYARATFAFMGPGLSQGKLEPGRVNQSSAAPEDLLSSLLAKKEIGMPLLALSLMVALGLGALHAMSPGHGKTIMAAYLVGTRGTAMHAVFLGMTVTVSHTVGVVALGLVVLYASHVIAPEVLYPWLGVVSGMVIIAIGAGLLLSRRRSGHSDYGNGSSHHHSHPHSHTHHHFEPQAGGRLRITWRSLAALGIVGGLVPSTSALILLLAAISLHRVGLGLLLVLAFSAGMALVLGSVGLALVYAARTVERVDFRHRWVVWATREVSLFAALVVVVSGLVMTARGLVQLGLT